jgi:hypothetical protein
MQKRRRDGTDGETNNQQPTNGANMKTAKVSEVIQIREWRKTPQDNPIYYHVIALDNGDKGSIGKRSSGAIKEGDTLNYTIDGDRIKEVQQNGFGGGFRGSAGGRGSTASFSLSYAKDLVIAAMPFHQDKTVNDWVEATKMIAGKFQTWLKENE